ncbi:hypothetical protein CWO85_01740 [Candidatus Phytoplasma ziziphi]|uniref:Uncharacterized protein n=1 Tax=Ziziphus jujuba witches'-broom phytoplasma TaxID=135727 RepID=A0A660HMJ8_ZIZJU|nr:hypothetical protein [Candidatus Phytoplasma ziziphi]AYJ01245.1 hypothetical protein CWO85_01740 [Candidatus Phytoplasma ziziphi]
MENKDKHDAFKPLTENARLKIEINDTANVISHLESLIIKLEKNEENGEIIRTATKTILAMRQANIKKINRRIQLLSIHGNQRKY